MDKPETNVAAFSSMSSSYVCSNQSDYMLSIVISECVANSAALVYFEVSLCQILFRFHVTNQLIILPIVFIFWWYSIYATFHELKYFLASPHNDELFAEAFCYHDIFLIIRYDRHPSFLHPCSHEIWSANIPIIFHSKYSNSFAHPINLYYFFRHWNQRPFG